MNYPLEKRVNVHPTKPITSTNPPIRSAVFGITITTDEIRSLIVERAMIEEVLEDGTFVSLDFSNYDKDNRKNPVVEPKKEEVVETLPTVEEESATDEEVVETIDPEEDEKPESKNFNNKHNKHRK